MSGLPVVLPGERVCHLVANRVEDDRFFVVLHESPRQADDPLPVETGADALTRPIEANRPLREVVPAQSRGGYRAGVGDLHAN